MGGIRVWVSMLAAALALAACARSGNPSVPAQPPADSVPAPAAAALETVAAPGAVPAPSAVPATPAGPAGPGVRVFLDPVTGEAREPTRSEAAAGAAAGRVQREAVGGQAGSEGTQREHFVLPDGTEGVKLAPRDRHAVTVCRQTDGSYSGNCPPAAGSARP
jgi:hypothetical protein